MNGVSGASRPLHHEGWSANSTVSAAAGGADACQASSSAPVVNTSGPYRPRVWGSHFSHSHAWIPSEVVPTTMRRSVGPCAAAACSRIPRAMPLVWSDVPTTPTAVAARRFNGIPVIDPAGPGMSSGPGAPAVMPAITWNAVGASRRSVQRRAGDRPSSALGSGIVPSAATAAFSASSGGLSRSSASRIPCCEPKSGPSSVAGRWRNARCPARRTPDPHRRGRSPSGPSSVITCPASWAWTSTEESGWTVRVTTGSSTGANESSSATTRRPGPRRNRPGRSGRAEPAPGPATWISVATLPS